MNVKYRIGIIDDFREERAFVEYRKYGELEVWNASRTGSKRKRQQTGDRIHVFLNFVKVGAFTDRQPADAEIRRLLDNAPVSLKDFEEYLFAPNH